MTSDPAEYFVKTYGFFMSTKQKNPKQPPTHTDTKLKWMVPLSDSIYKKDNVKGIYTILLKSI